jgi:uncharacterized SAM-binding protein YcdF (DUF218 family)
VGNAQEIAAWADAKYYDSLIVVTSDYHMARALTEIRAAAPGVQLTPMRSRRRRWTIRAGGGPRSPPGA